MENQFLINLNDNIIIKNIINPWVILVIILIFTFKEKQQGIKFLISVITVNILTQILKSIIKQPLPIETPYNFIPEKWEQIRTTTYSMPSGHATLVTSLVVNIIIRLSHIIKNKILHHTICTSLIAILFIKCYLTWYIGYHYIQDILLGIILATCYTIILEKYLFNKDTWIPQAKKYIIVIMIIFLTSLLIDSELKRLLPYIIIISIILLIPNKYIIKRNI